LKLKDRIIKVLNKEGIMSMNAMSKKLKIRRGYLSGYLQALSDVGILKGNVVGKARVYTLRSK